MGREWPIAASSCSKRRAEPHLGAIELTQFGITEEDAMHVLIHLFQPDLFVAENFADEDPALMPANVPRCCLPAAFGTISDTESSLPCWGAAECWARRCFPASRWPEPRGDVHG